MKPSPIWLITPDFADREQALLLRLRMLLQAGIRLVQYRCRGEGSDPWCRDLEATIALCREYQASLILNAAPSALECFAVDGIHLNSGRLMSCTSRPLPDDCWLSASCHNLDELRHAEALGVDCVTLSPVIASRSHPDVPALGWSRFREWVMACALPVYALGGLHSADLEVARANGACGLAMIRGLWEEPGYDSGPGLVSKSEGSPGKSIPDLPG